MTGNKVDDNGDSATDMMTMTTSPDVEVNVNNTASSKAAARREAEVVQIFVTRQPAGKNEEGGSRMDA